MSWEENLIEDPRQISAILKDSHVVAVLGMGLDDRPDRPAYSVPLFLKKHGYEIIPVPVKYPHATEVAGLHAYRSLMEIPAAIDIVEVFRSPLDIPEHLDDILAKKPKVVWLQSGIRHEQAAEKLARAGIKVVQDHCMKIELLRLNRNR